MKLLRKKREEKKNTPATEEEKISKEEIQNSLAITHIPGDPIVQEM